MKFPKDVLLQSIAQRKDDKSYGLEFVQELGNDDAGASEMLVLIFKYKDKYYDIEIKRINGENNYDHWEDEIECPEVVRKEAIQYYWQEVKS